MIPHELQKIFNVNVLSVLSEWSRDIVCERPRKKRIHPPASADSFTWERQAKKFALQDCMAQGIAPDDRCTSCKVKRLAVQIDNIVMDAWEKEKEDRKAGKKP